MVVNPSPFGIPLGLAWLGIALQSCIAIGI